MIQKRADKANNYAFIDSQNLNLNIRNQGWILDFARFRVYLKEKHGLSYTKEKTPEGRNLKG